MPPVPPPSRQHKLHILRGMFLRFVYRVQFMILYSLMTYHWNPSTHLLSRSQEWLVQHQDHGRIVHTMVSAWPRGSSLMGRTPGAGMVHLLVISNESMSIFRNLGLFPDVCTSSREFGRDLAKYKALKGTSAIHVSSVWKRLRICLCLFTCSAISPLGRQAGIHPSPSSKVS